MPHFHRSPYLLLTLASLFWSGNMVVGRAIRGDVPPLALSFWRWIIALICVLPLARPHFRQGWPVLKRHWLTITLLGLLGIGGFNTFAYIGLQYTTATNAVLLNSFIPVVVIAISWAFLGKTLRKIEGTGVLVSLLGALTIIAQGDPQLLFSLQLNLGDLWLLLAVLVWALYTIGLSHRPGGVHPMLMLAAFMIVGLIAITPAWLWELSGNRSIHLHTGSLLGILYVGILPSFVGYIFYNRGVAEIGPNRASIFIHLMPVFGTLLSALFLGEVPQGFHYAGIALIFTGIGLTMKKP